MTVNNKIIPELNSIILETGSDIIIDSIGTERHSKSIIALLAIMYLILGLIVTILSTIRILACCIGFKLEYFIPVFGFAFCFNYT